MSGKSLEFGIKANRSQFTHLLLQVFWVGMTLGLVRTVVPAVAESEFHVPRDSFALLTAFVVSFGFVKGVMNFVAGRLSEYYGRKLVLIWGWLVAIPVPFILFYGTSWNWVVFSTVLLGINQ
ncbi:MAG: hypothetical protein COA74_03005 [Gammaproteobacteria bacterium]|nr:MAG: hypothetical protein COA74_03005 [Gammaproteobacteria bacterium]